MSGFQSPITIAQAVEHIQCNEFLLPAFQRDFVWSSGQIESLFDSLMRGYPIGSLLFWKVKGKTKADFKFYKFLNQYIQRHKTSADVFQTDALNDFHAILDGQQRLTALYIGLCGSYASKGYRRRWDNNERNFPVRHLYLNISKTNGEESDRKYIFNFLNKENTKEEDIYCRDSDQWFRVGRILSLHKDDYGIDEFADEHKISKESKRILRHLERVIHDERSINYYEEDEQRPDKAVNIFVRINSGGTALSLSDILMSIAVANFKKIDARTEINNLLGAIHSKGFYISRDFILKSFLYLYHKDVRTLISSFNAGFIDKIEDNWVSIRDALLSLFDLLKSFGLNQNTMTSYNAALPILYYLYHKGIYNGYHEKVKYRDDALAIRTWLFSMLLRRVFGSSSDTVLQRSRRAFTADIESAYIDRNIEHFPAEAINKEIRRISDVGDDFIEELLRTQKDSKYSFAILAMLYPDLDYRNYNFHMDHLHPVSSFGMLKDEDKANYGWETYNSILNLQMLDANENESKKEMALKDWVKQQTDDKGNDKSRFLQLHLIPDTDLSLDNFAVFIEERKKLLTAKLKSLIN